MDNTCVFKSDSGEEFKIKSGSLVKLPFDPKIEISYNPCENNVEMKYIGDACVLLNGYKVIAKKSYRMVSGDCLQIGEATRYFLEINGGKRSRSPVNTEVKKPKLAPIFQKKMATSVKGNYDGSWELIKNQLLIFTPPKLESKSKILAFDMDNTLIKTKSGKTFPVDFKDWMLFHPNVPKKIKSYFEDGFKIVIFTNQLHIGNHTVDINPFKEKVSNILNEIGCPVQVFAALKKDIYRKPATGMWNVLIEEKNEDVTVDLKNSLYVGDAAGRVAGWEPKKKKDHSLADRLFALNIGVKFLTPEEFFLGGKPGKFVMPEFDPRNINIPGDDIKFNDDEQEVILMVGCPASGKSTFCEAELKPRGYVYVNRDKLGSWNTCIKHMENGLKQMKSVVIDNTNRDKETRKRYIDVAKQYKVPIRCFVMKFSKDMSKHNNRFREITDKSHVTVTDIVLHSYFKHYEEPEKSEGFKEIVRVGFKPTFASEDLEKLYKMFLMDK